MIKMAKYLNKIKKTDLMILIIIFPFFEPGGLAEIRVINRFLLVWRLVSILWGGFCILSNTIKSGGKYEVKKDGTIKLVLLMFFAIIVCSAAINQSLAINSIWQYMNIVFISFYYSYQLKYRKESILRLTSNIMIGLNVINLLTVIGGVSFSSEEDMYFFGIRTAFTIYIVFMIMTVMYDSCLRKKKLFTAKTWFAIFLGTAQILLEWIATGIVCLALFLGLIWYFALVKKRAYKHIAVILTCSGITLNYLIVYGNIQNYFAFLIEDILHKTLSLHDRTYIWENVLAKINESPIIGYGTMYERVRWYSRELLAHNLWLQIMLAGGVALTVCFGIMLLLIAKNIDVIEDINIKSVCIATIGVVLALSITEVIYTTYRFWILLIILSGSDFVKKNFIPHCK